MKRCRCRYCGKKDKTGGDNCSVCGIAFGAQKKDVSKEARRKAYFYRSLYYLGVWCIIYGLMRLTAAALNIVYEHGPLAGVAIVFLLGAFDVAVGVGLLRYRRWCYWAGIALIACETALMTYFAAPNEYILIWLIAFLCLYYLMNKTSKEILYCGR